jgi:hypothetical protein
MPAALLLLLLCPACASSLQPRTASSHRTQLLAQPPLLRTQPLFLRLRGGRRRDIFGNMRVDVEEAVELFGNMRVPAALIAGAIVPLATFAGPVVSKLDAPALVPA